LFERYQRSEKALVCAMMEMYIEGVSTRKVAKVTEALCGTEFSAGMEAEISQGNSLSRWDKMERFQKSPHGAKRQEERGEFLQGRLSGIFPGFGSFS